MFTNVVLSFGIFLCLFMQWGTRTFSKILLLLEKFKTWLYSAMCCLSLHFTKDYPGVSEESWKLPFMHSNLFQLSPLKERGISGLEQGRFPSYWQKLMKRLYTLLSALQNYLAYNRCIILALEWVWIHKTNSTIKVVRRSTILSKGTLVPSLTDYRLLILLFLLKNEMYWENECSDNIRTMISGLCEEVSSIFGDFKFKIEECQNSWRLKLNICKM